MATARALPSKLLLRPSLRQFTSASPTSGTAFPLEPAVGKPPSPPLTSSDTLLDLNDHEKLFASVSTLKLLRASTNLHMAAVEPVVDMGSWVMNSRLMAGDNLVRDLLLAGVKHTFYEHFCAGENWVEVEKAVGKVNECGLRGMLAYAVEHTSENEACDRNLEGFMESVEIAKQLPSSVSFVVVKMTAICPTSLLGRVSDLLRWQQGEPCLKLRWKHNSFPVLVDSSPLYHTLKKPQPLTAGEERDLQTAHDRLLKLCQKSLQANVPLVIDAEDSYLQPAIDYLTYSSAIMYNKDKDEKPMVYGTMQAYLKDAKERLLAATKAAEKMGVAIGFKLVRGAYMSSETKTASSLGYDSPIHNTIQDTHDCYNQCSAFMLPKVASGSAGLILATHNVESGQLAARKAIDLGMRNGNKRLEFAQLYGMSEALSFGLRNAGFQVSKYMPYGPVDMVIPYLLRRAEENRGLLSASNLDRQLMRKELKRRLKDSIPKLPANIVGKGFLASY